MVNDVLMGIVMRETTTMTTQRTNRTKGTVPDATPLGSNCEWCAVECMVWWHSRLEKNSMVRGHPETQRSRVVRCSSTLAFRGACECHKTQAQ